MSMTIETRDIADVHPYENNPRTISQQAIEVVAESIRLYGWNQPIVVDQDGVIIVGHTRRLAAESLGMTQVPVLVATDLTPEQVKQYRLVDNRTGELSSWDYDNLVMELREFHEDLVQSFFPEIDLEAALVQEAAGTQEDVDRAAAKIANIQGAADDALHTTVVVCPSCTGRFNVRTKSLPGMQSAEAMEAVTTGGAE